MERNHCHYHPVQPATWCCPSCPRQLGDCCVPLNADASEQAPRCPLCQNPLNYLGAANTAQPFWERIPKFFLYALQTGPLAFAALLALATAFMPGSLLVWIVLLSVATKYLYSVITANAEMLDRAPSLQSAFVGDGFDLFFKQLAIFILAGVALGMSAGLGSEAFTVAVSLTLMLLMPASIIRLALDREFTSALNPMLVGRVIKAMGWRYLILWVFLFIIWQSIDYVIYMLAHGLSLGLLMPVASAVLAYFSVVMCAMMGYVVFQYQGALGYVIADDSQLKFYPEQEYGRRKALADAEVRLKEGQPEQALEAIAATLERAPNDLKLNERFHQLLFALNNRDRCLRHLAHYLPLVALANPALAVNALLNARQLQGDYLPGDALVCEQVAEALLARHKVREGLSLLRNLHQRFPAYAHIPRAYLLAARGFAEGLGQLEPARQLLGFIRSRYPNSALLGEVASLEAVIGQLATAQSV
ncbi:hypothetical protein [Pseudomonas sp.]|uniref:hypothetical protein n=1 Tax=Pseudomonas sp. TaxID=306 RepID=UPI003981CB21